jgi:hypothetical protein
MALIDCREASQLTSAELDRPLTLGERVRLSVHRLMCAPCRIYRRQLVLLHRQVARLPAVSSDIRLDDSARERIQARLRDAIEREGGT